MSLDIFEKNPVIAEAERVNNYVIEIQKKLKDGHFYEEFSHKGISWGKRNNSKRYTLFFEGKPLLEQKLEVRLEVGLSGLDEFLKEYALYMEVIDKNGEVNEPNFNR